MTPNRACLVQKSTQVKFTRLVYFTPRMVILSNQAGKIHSIILRCVVPYLKV
jgi:hypothetical protein